MTSSGALPTLGGETREVTMFFSDVVGFSTLSEAMKPEEIVSLMNSYLTSMSEAIEEAGGFVDKYVGDAIVAIFGAPVRSADHAIEAVTAALDCQRRLEAFNREHASPIQHRIGLNTGEALIGNIGSRRRFNYTAFGDNVNLASRLEQVNTSFGSSILAAESVVTATGAATINGGTVDVQAAAGTYGLSTTYTILTATGGVTGAFISATSNFIFLTPTLNYDANAVTLTLAQPGVTHVIIMEGINDISRDSIDVVSADDIIFGLKQVVDRAHERGIVVFGATLTPFDRQPPSPAREAKRQAINAWIRYGGAFDGVIDFASALADPLDPARLAPAYDSGDHLHPNAAGYRAMAGAVSLPMLLRAVHRTACRASRGCAP